MQRSLSQLLSAVLLTGTTAAGTGIFSAPVAADIHSAYQPGFLRKAERALARDKPEQALQTLNANSERAMKRHHRAEANGLVCRAHLELNDPVAARSACSRALELEGNRSRWRFLNNLGVAELTLGNYDAAESAFTKAAALGGWASTPRHNLKLLHDFREANRAASSAQVIGQVR